MAANAELQQQVEALKYFLATAPANWEPAQTIRRFLLPNGEYISCVLWKDLFHVTGTDIVRALIFRFQAFGRPIKNMKKFEEGVFSDLRNLKPGIDASLEEPRSEFLEMLYKSSCIRTQKKQKVFYWFSVPHDQLFMDALERDLKREALGQEPTTVAVSAKEASVGLLPSSLVSSAHRTSTQMPSFNSEALSRPSFSDGTFDSERSSSHSSLSSIMHLDQGSHRTSTQMPSFNSEPLSRPSFSDGASDCERSSSHSSLSSIMHLDQGYGSFDDINKMLLRNDDRERSSSHSSLSSIMHLDQGYGSFDDVNKMLLRNDESNDHESFLGSPILSAQHADSTLMSDLAFDLPGHIAPSLLSVSHKPAENHIHTHTHIRAHSFSHNLAAAAVASPNPLFGTYSMFEGSANYKQRRRSSGLSNESSSDGRGHRRSFSSGSATVTSEANSKESSPFPSMDGEGLVDRRNYNCSFASCGRKFKRYEHLKRHYRTHTNERPYVCNIQGCGKSFSRSDNLSQHFRVHQKSSIESLSMANSAPLVSCNSIGDHMSDYSSESSESSVPSTPSDPLMMDLAELDGMAICYEESPFSFDQSNWDYMSEAFAPTAY